MRILLFSRFIIILLFVFLFASCEIINPKVTVPAYITIPSFVFKTDEITQGTNSNKITDVWVYVDDQLIGTFELPAKFPVIKDGLHKVEIRAGIKLNGISSTRIDYPYLESFTSTVLLTPNQETIIIPTFTYYSNTVFKWLENFENIGVSISENGTSVSKFKLLQNSSEVFEGKKCGYVEMDQTNNFFEIGTKEEYDLPKEGATVILELNYKNSEEMLVGIYANTPSSVTQELALKLRATTNASGNLEWNKIYINLTPFVSKHTTATSYKVFFGGTLRDKPDVSKAVYYIDNVKLIHR